MIRVRLERFSAALILLGAVSAASLAAQSVPVAQARPTQVYPAASWQRIAVPESAGYSSKKLAEVRAKLATMQTTGLVAVVGGRVLFEYGDVDTVTYVASVRKSILSMLYGIYVGRGVINLERTLEQLGIDDVGGLTRAEKQAKVRHLLAARSGVYHAASNPGDNLADAPPRGSQPPGTYFLYSNWDFNALGDIFEQFTHQSIFDALQHDLAEPIHMQDFHRELHRRTGDTALSTHLAYHMFFSTRDMARLGYLMLRGGNWNGRQIIPAAWVRESTSAITPNGQMNPAPLRNSPWGYGYLWWVMDAPRIKPPFRGYMAMGAFGQYIVVLPAIDLVVAHKTAAPGNRDVSQNEFLTVLEMIAGARIKRETPR